MQRRPSALARRQRLPGPVGRLAASPRAVPGIGPGRGVVVAALCTGGQPLADATGAPRSAPAAVGAHHVPAASVGQGEHRPTTAAAALPGPGEQRKGGWLAAKEQAYDLGGPTRFPLLNCQRSFELLLGLPDALRRGSGAQVELIRRQAPLLLNSPSTRPTPSSAGLGCGR